MCLYTVYQLPFFFFLTPLLLRSFDTQGVGWEIIGQNADINKEAAFSLLSVL